MLLYQHFTNRKDEEFDFDEFLSEIPIEKERKKVKMFSKQMCVSSQKHRMKKEEGATLPFLSWLTRLLFVGRKAVSTEEVQTIGKYS